MARELNKASTSRTSLLRGTRTAGTFGAFGAEQLKIGEALRSPLRTAAERPSLLLLPGALAFACAQLVKLPIDKVNVALLAYAEHPSAPLLRELTVQLWPFAALLVAILLLAYAASYAVATYETEYRTPGLLSTLLTTTVRAPAIVLTSIVAAVCMLILALPAVTLLTLVYLDIPQGMDRLPLSFAAGALFGFVLLGSLAPLGRLLVAYLIALSQRISLFSALYLARLLTRQRLLGLAGLLAITIFLYGSVTLAFAAVVVFQLTPVTSDTIVTLSLFAAALGLWHFIGACTGMVLAWYNKLSHEHMRSLTEAYRLEPPAAVAAPPLTGARKRQRKPRFTSALTADEVRSLLLQTE